MQTRRSIIPPFAEKRRMAEAQSKRARLYTDIEPVIYALARQSEIAMVLLDNEATAALIDHAVARLAKMLDQLKQGYRLDDFSECES